jgi:serine/threonine protein kinase
MSPEQCRGERDLTFKSDLYSMGVMFYELLVGRKPFEADNAMNMFLQHVNATFERPGRLVGRGGLCWTSHPGSTRSSVSCLRKNPNKGRATQKWCPRC